MDIIGESKTREKSKIVTYWKIPSMGKVKLNVDSSITSDGRWGFRVVIRDESNFFATTTLWSSPGMDDVAAKAKAMWLGLCK